MQLYFIKQHALRQTLAAQAGGASSDALDRLAEEQTARKVLEKELEREKSPALTQQLGRTAGARTSCCALHETPQEPRTRLETLQNIQRCDALEIRTDMFAEVSGPRTVSHGVGQQNLGMLPREVRA